jgi:phage-related protein
MRWSDVLQPKKIPLIFFRTLTGGEPVREWLEELPVLVALHGFIKKTRATSDEDLALARKRKKELER